jgi:hypothetical protein
VFSMKIVIGCMYRRNRNESICASVSKEEWSFMLGRMFVVSNKEIIRYF